MLGDNGIWRVQNTNNKLWFVVKAGKLPADAGGTERQGIIVVASLLDKAPNLAGLARTCEVMCQSARLDDLHTYPMSVTALTHHHISSSGRYVSHLIILSP